MATKPSPTPSQADPPFKMPVWPADQIERRDPRKLKPHPKNPNRHSAEQIKAIRAAIDEFGWTQPELIDEKNKIWAGHGRNLAALVIDEDGKPLEYGPNERRPLPLEEVPVVVARGWSEAKKEAYMLADKRLAEMSEWDVDRRRDLLNSLDGLFDLRLAGFDDETLRIYTADPNAGQGDPDEYVPTPMPAPCVELGDLWQLGEHFLICGDATSPDVVARLMQKGPKPNVMATDPPYGVDYDPMWRNRVKRQDGSLVGAKAVGEVQNDDRDDWTEAYALFPGNIIYVWHGGLHSSPVQFSIEAAGFVPRAQIIWNKQQFVIGRGDYHWKHEACWYAVRKGKSGKWCGDRKQSTVWDIPAPSGWMQIKEGADAHTGIHSTQKPVECMRRPILNNTMPGDAVYEPFCGSGTTIIACEIEGRRCLAIELKPAYVQVAIERWQKFSGKLATLAGKTLVEVAAERGKPLGAINQEETDEARSRGVAVRRSRVKPAGAVDEAAG